MTTVGSQVYLHKRCRACNGTLREILNLGNLRLNGFPSKLVELEKIQRVPLILTHCTECGLVQLDRTVPPDWMYREYWYRSSVNESMVAELTDVVESGIRQFGGQPLVVMDVGANDGTLLRAYRKKDMVAYRVAVEPARNLTGLLEEQEVDDIIPDFFPSARILSAYRRRVDLLTAVAMCYDVERPREFFQAIHDLLAPDGLAIIQFQDFGQQLEAAAFDNICHEHLEYYTLWSLTHLLRQTGLQAVHVERRAINGGSLRVYLRRSEDSFPVQLSVAYQLILETQLQLDTPAIRGGIFNAFHRFGRQVSRARTQIDALLQLVDVHQHTLDVYGASTKGNILLQVLGLGPEQVRQAIDRDQRKHGRFTLTGIPIVGEYTGRTDYADVWLCPIWQFRESVLAREQAYLQRGGRIIFPLPIAELVQDTYTFPRTLDAGRVTE